MWLAKKRNGWMEFSQDFDKDTQLVVAAAAVRRGAEKRIKPNSPCCYSAMDGRMKQKISLSDVMTAFVVRRK